MEKKDKPKKSGKLKEHIKRSPHTEDLVDHYWGSINYVSDLIKSSELKAGLILSFYGILLNFIYQGVEALTHKPSGNTLMYSLIGLWVLCTCISIYYCVRCFMPKIEGKYTPNVFFFGDVITRFGDIKQFSKTFFEISLDEYTLFEQLGEQIYISSKIAAWKFKNVKRAIYFLAISLVVLLILAAHYVMVYFF
ncbi:Pycsar system effector family protein [Gaetbulibacter aestuarii]|uniref:Pycsar system effector family protein n=1 Tax=Gaetbulibacter aestuarii TaxID=1502358 RepID=A0ABW7MV94_9FLAO